jgi:hypothetical protein
MPSAYNLEVMLLKSACLFSRYAAGVDRWEVSNIGSAEGQTAELNCH